MTSQRRRKKEARHRGVSLVELELLELLEEILEEVRWSRILGFSNQFLMTRRLDVAREERDAILEAATRAAEADGKMGGWSSRLQAIRARLGQVERELEGPAGEAAEGTEPA